MHIAESSSVQRDLMSFSPIATRKARNTDAPKKEIKEFSDFSDFPEEPVSHSNNPFRPLSMSMPNLPVEPVSTEVVTTSLATMSLALSVPAETVSAPPKMNHPNAAGNYPTSYPVQYTTGPVLVPHPYAPSAVIAHVVGPVSM